MVQMKRIAHKAEKGIYKKRRYDSYRSSMTALKNIFDTYKVNKELVVYIKKTPFWLLIEPFIYKKYPSSFMRKSDQLIRQLIETYSKNDRGFKIGNKILKLRKEDVMVCLGLVSGEIQMNLNYIKRPENRLTSCIPKGEMLTAVLIKKAIDKKWTIEEKSVEDYEDITKFLCLLILATFLIPSSQSYVPWAWTIYVDDLENMKKYDLAGAILDNLSTCLQNMKNAETCKGCVPLIMIFFCEHITVLKPSVDNLFPRFLKWSLPIVSSKLTKMNLQEISSKEVYEGVLPLSSVEKEILGFCRSSIVGEDEEMGPIEADYHVDREITTIEVTNDTNEILLVCRDLTMEKGLMSQLSYEEEEVKDEENEGEDEENECEDEVAQQEVVEEEEAEKEEENGEEMKKSEYQDLKKKIIQQNETINLLEKKVDEVRKNHEEEISFLKSEINILKKKIEDGMQKNEQKYPRSWSIQRAFMLSALRKRKNNKISSLVKCMKEKRNEKRKRSSQIWDSVKKVKPISSQLSIDPRSIQDSFAQMQFNQGNSSMSASNDVQSGASSKADFFFCNSQTHQDDLKRLGFKIKHHEENLKLLKDKKNKVDDSIVDMQVVLGKRHSSNIPTTEDPSHNHNKEKMTEQIQRLENSAAGIVWQMITRKVASQPLWTKDVLGIVASLGKVNDENLSRLFSEYLGVPNMLALVCKTVESVKALETYYNESCVNKSSGLDGLGSSIGRHLEGQFFVICLQSLRPYTGEYLANDPQKRLDLLKPRFPNGECPPGFLGFAVNMITVENEHLFCVTSNGYGIRETLFYHLFSRLQVYKTKTEMFHALPCISDGAVSLDGGILKATGVFLLGHREDVNVKFGICSSKTNLPWNYQEMENNLMEAKWEKDRLEEDILREQALLSQAKNNFDTKKTEYIKFLTESSSYFTRVTQQ